MINTIIIDDEAHCTDSLSKLLGEHCARTISLSGTFSSVEDGIRGIRELHPDLVFLDVMLHEKTGFDLLKELPSIAFDIIFTTAFDTFAVQAFKFSALDYLLKPVDPDDLIQAVNKVKNKIAREQAPGQLATLFHNLKSSLGVSKKIAIPTVSGLKFIEVNDIVRCQSEVNYTLLFLKDKQKITVARTLKEFEDMLAEHHFFRVHNSHLINLSCVKSYQRGKGGTIRMSDDSSVEVASRRKEDFLKKMLG
jgi:two-component system LytT family response regulator